jgi:hypothetical protein
MHVVEHLGLEVCDQLRIRKGFAGSIEADLETGILIGAMCDRGDRKRLLEVKHAPPTATDLRLRPTVTQPPDLDFRARMAGPSVPKVYRDLIE